MKYLRKFKEKNNKIDDILKYLILIIPLSLIAGPLIPEIAILISSVIILYKLKLKEIFEYDKYLFYIFFLFYIVILSGSLLSNNLIFSIKSTFPYFRFFILIIAIYYILNNTKNFLYLLKNLLIIIFLILIFDGIYQFIFHENIIGLKNVNKYRVSSFFGKELVYGSYLSKFLPLLIGLLIYLRENIYDSIYIYIILCLSIAAIFISGERSSFFLTLISLFIILSSTNFFLKSKKFIFLILVTLFIVFVSSGDYMKKRMTTTFYDSVVKTFNKKIKFDNKEYKVILSEKNTFLIMSAIKMFKDKPFFGHGVKTFRINCKEDPYKFEKFDAYGHRMNCSTHPHNTYVQLLAETGFFGFIFIFSIFLYIFFELAKGHFYRLKIANKKLYDLRICILTCIFISLFPLTTTGSFFNNWISIIYFYPIGILLYLNKSIKS